MNPQDVEILFNELLALINLVLLKDQASTPLWPSRPDFFKHTTSKYIHKRQAFEDGHFLIECVNGSSPEECTYDSGNDRSVAYFKIETCNACPYRDKCQPRFLKTRVRKEVSWKSVGRAKQLQYMKTHSQVTKPHCHAIFLL